MTSSRRNFLSQISVGAAALAADTVAAPPAYAGTNEGGRIPGKGQLTILNNRPLNAEAPAHLLDAPTTPTAMLFVRNNGLPPVQTAAESWSLQIAGESCVRPQSFSVTQLRSRFAEVSLDLQLECGGNGRAEFRPRASGNQWTTGAVGCPRWTGVRLKDVLEYCGVKTDAQYVGYVGADQHLSGDADKVVISRGVPLRKALEPETLIAYALNGEPIPLLHGAPLRLVCAGWPGSVSGKWLTTLLVRDRVHDGAKMGGSSYRVPCMPVAPGAEVAVRDMCIIESMPVKSLITAPASGVRLAHNSTVQVRGQAWAGDLAVAQMHVSTDFGATWQQAELAAPVNRLAWQQWQLALRLESAGYHEIWARATDALGRSQPMLVPGWNPKGYLNNAAHRIAVQVG